jgi:hypothetical protein
MVHIQLEGDLLVPGVILTWDQELMDGLKERLADRIRFVDIRQLIDRYFEHELPRLSPDEVRADYKEFKDYYFLHNNDRPREHIFLDRISGDQNNKSRE